MSLDMKVKKDFGGFVLDVELILHRDKRNPKLAVEQQKQDAEFEDSRAHGGDGHHLEILEERDSGRSR